ncbi:cytosolic phospholipase A2 zeta isoform X6 [Choloepus didactylus]|uniref:cytosolic phospholipase A2 zeta isoform X6 n=1 Tax=Choloepus didactylus TaxID=27675 RepID=UPI00189EDF5A|nr:cytosolic phospholipase A2 zeta isoform X6 [Choloepus didactylus]
MITRQLSLGTRMLVPDPLGEGVNCLLLRKLGSSHFRPHLQIQQSSSTRHTPVPPVRPELQGVQPESRVALGSRQGSLLGTGLPSHAPGALARVAGGQGAAPPGGSTAAEEREEGSSLEALAAQAAVSLVAYQTSTNWVTLGLPPRTCSPVSCLLALRETHPYYDLQVKVLRARNIRGTDLLSKADCYVQLWLPTASPSPTQTRTVANCSDPEWNEVFHYQIHGAVKNVLELTLYDKDVLGSDQLSLLLFDLRSLRPGQPHRHTFLLDRQDSQELQVEFVLEKSQVPASEVITNGVLVVQPCLRIQGTLGGDERAPHRDYVKADQGWNGLPSEGVDFLSLEVFKHRGYRQIQLAVPGAYEKPQLLPLKYPVEQSLPSTFTFHVNPVLSSSLDIELWEKLMVLQSSPSAELEAQNSKLGEGGIVLSSLPLGREEQRIVALGEGQEVTLSVKAEMSSGDLDLRLGFDLCDGEQEFLDKRKQVVSKALQKVLGLSEAPDSGQENAAKLSDQQEAVSQGQNPYPIYASVNVRTNISGEDFAEWCEFTPYEVGFPKYGAYVPTELFSSEFFMGRLLKLRPEPRICYLQGVWGSAFAASLDEIFLKTAGLSLGFLDSHRGSVDITDDCQKLQQPDPARLRTRLFTPQGPFSQAVLDICTSRFTSAETFNFTRGLCLHKDYVAGREFVAWKDTHPDAFPNELTPMKDCLYLVDGGFAINSPFPLALLPQRAVDLILSFDYSLDAPFEVLQMTEKYCRDRGIPFPKIEVCPGDLEEPRECYLFAEAEDPRSPIVLHFPLVNHTFRTHLAPVVERQTAEEKAFGDFVISGPDTPYGMMNFTYKPEEFDRLVALSRYNVLNNAETLRGALCLALDRRQAGG